jgi:uncharacterized protein YndB with AHSA1/START domain
MTAPPDLSAPAASDRARLVIAREFAAAPERVWQAWANPEEMVRWLGPVEWQATQVEAVLQVGGAWRACLTARDGSDVLWQSGRYLAVEPPHLLRFTFRWEGKNHEDGPGVETIVTVRFEPLAGGRTRLTLIQEGLASEASARGHAHGWGSTFDRLAQVLQTEGEERRCN